MHSPLVLVLTFPMPTFMCKVGGRISTSVGTLVFEVIGGATLKALHDISLFISWVAFTAFAHSRGATSVLSEISHGAVPSLIVFFCVEEGSGPLALTSFPFSSAFRFACGLTIKVGPVLVHSSYLPDRLVSVTAVPFGSPSLLVVQVFFRFLLCHASHIVLIDVFLQIITTCFSRYFSIMLHVIL